MPDLTARAPAAKGAELAGRISFQNRKRGHVGREQEGLQGKAARGRRQPRPGPRHAKSEPRAG